MRAFILIAIFINAFTLAFPDYFQTLESEFEQKLTGQVRRFFITAEEQIWDYASECSSKSNVPDSNVLGTKYYKALYHEYEDSTFTKRKAKFHWQGNMGPILRAEVGDVIQVLFWNRASRNYTIHPHGVFYEFEMEGAVFMGSYENSAIRPNATYLYTWNVLPRSGPGPKDGNSIVWGYHSHVQETDIYAGLYGSIVIYKPGTISNNEIVTSLFVADENQSPYLSHTISTLYPDFDQSKYGSSNLYRANQLYSINGLLSSSPKDLVVNNSIDWHLLGWGTHWDVQQIAWEDGDVIQYDKTVEYVRLMPASFYTITLKPKTNGQWKFGALENQDGMVMQYNVSM